jgi:hypothetical protein
MKKVAIIILLFFSIVYIFRNFVQESESTKKELLDTPINEILFVDMEDKIENKTLETIQTVENPSIEVEIPSDKMLDSNDGNMDDEENNNEISENFSSLEEISEEEMIKHEMKILEEFAYYEFEQVSYHEKI